ncbi:hypothetical protein GCM10029992_01310 [Glycomyces albus]
MEADQSVTDEDPEMRETARLREMRAEWWRRRHRRILYVLIALTLVELIGVIVAGPGFWIGAGLAAVLLGAYVYFLRARAKRLLRSKAAHPARAMLTAEPEHPEQGPPTYVPEQPGSEGDYEPEADEHRESFLFENGTLSGREDEPPPRPEARHGDHPAGIRGRSYESPAKLERLCLSRPNTATSSPSTSARGATSRATTRPWSACGRATAWSGSPRTAGSTSRSCSGGPRR